MFTSVDVLVILTAAIFLFLGHELSRRIWSGETTPSMPVERIASAGLLGLSVWIGSLWILGLTHLLTREALLVRTILAALLAVALRVKTSRRNQDVAEEVRPARDRDTLLIIAIAAVPILLWATFAMWRGAVLPPLSHDALSYHLPKAVLFARAHAYIYIEQLFVVARQLPPNYELMLTDVILTTGSDRVTEWLSTLHYLLFIVAGVGLVQRWWGVNAKRDAIVALVIAQIPVALLQSSAHKNDLLLAFLVIAAVMWGARFCAAGETPAAILMILAMAMAVGTKPQAAFVAIALAPFVLWRLWRERAGRRLLALIVASVVALALLGGASYAIDLKHGLTSKAPQAEGNAVTTFQFNDVANFWQAPYVLIAEPFSRHDFSLYVPWESSPWFWRRYEIYFSHLGVGLALALLALPSAIVRLRRERSTERAVASIATLCAFVAMLPVAGVPHGMYLISLPRYALFITPAVLGWSVEAAVRSRESLARIGLLVSAAMFVIYGIDSAVNDSFAPLRFAIWASEHPGTRLVPFAPNRASCILDRIAGPYDKVAIDAGFGSWIYPAFGRDLTRPVQLLTGKSPLTIDADVRWVVIDRGYEAVWNQPGYRDLSQTLSVPSRAQLTPQGQLLMQEALALPGFRPVLVNAREGQAILLRR
jgi:hypothetical protein